MRCLSTQGDQVYGVRLVTYGEARKRKKGRILPVEMTLAFPEATRAVLELSMADESRLQPLRSELTGSKPET
jgi:hypothetical protein